jgi:hypothetical protein
MSNLFDYVPNGERLRISIDHREADLDVGNTSMYHARCPLGTIFFARDMIPGYRLDAITSGHIAYDM